MAVVGVGVKTARRRLCAAAVEVAVGQRLAREARIEVVGAGCVEVALVYGEAAADVDPALRGVPEHPPGRHDGVQVPAFAREDVHVKVGLEGRHFVVVGVEGLVPHAL